MLDESVGQVDLTRSAAGDGKQDGRRDAIVLDERQHEDVSLASACV